MAAPQEALSAGRCYRDAAAAPRDARDLVPPHVAQLLHDRSGWPGADDARVSSHPLARHMPLFSAHLARLCRTTAALHALYPDVWTHAWSMEELLSADALQHVWDAVLALQGTDTPQLRVSLRVHRDGRFYAVMAPLSAPAAAAVPVRWDTQPVLLDGPSTPYKTDFRDEYDAARRRVHGTLGAADGTTTCFDVLLWHERDGTRIATESSIANLVLERSEAPRFVTPAFAHLLPGVLVQELVRQGVVVPQPLAVSEIDAAVQQGARLWLCNSVRGMMEVSL